MSGNKNINKICVIITVIAVLVTALFMNGKALGIAADDSVSLGYEDKIFDDSYVHTIDIEIDDFDSFIETATSEEYSVSNVTIDGETIKNVGIRCKGNTSLTTVSQLDSDRYSFKIEFDCFESSGNYYGLDKLCLNNLIQDYTMMKDYITYKLMNEFGVDSPLVSYCFITVNGEDWGLYLAVEAVEDSFLERNYGSNYGELYKPDTMSMGGGRGNGGDFDMKNVDFEKMGMDNPFEKKSDKNDSDDSVKDGDTGGDDNTINNKDDTDSETNTPQTKSESAENEDEKSSGEMPGFSGEAPDFQGTFPGGNSDGNNEFPSGGPGGFAGGAPFGMGSDDAKLKYTDDDIDSYSAIFDSAKTKIKKSDKKRLISSIKALNEGIENSDSELIESAVDVEKLMRYMVVHNFVVNGDSYTGSMIHNFYLYEEDGLMSMIPWDYNLAFGTFQGQDATGIINDPIDTPQSITENDTDRPMFDWIISTEEYTEEYHEYFKEFIDKFYTSGYLSELINNTYEMLYDYVDKDPTKFCTIEEFEKAVQTISEFVNLRCESIQGQLDGTIPSTDSGQKEDSSNLIDASSLTLTDMGSMGGGGGPSGGGPSGGGPSVPSNDESSGSGTSDTGLSDGETSGDVPTENDSVVSTSADDSATDKAAGDNSFPGGDNPFEGNGNFQGGDNPFGGAGGPPDNNPFGDGGLPGNDSSVNTTDYVYAGISAAAMLLAILFAVCFKRRKLPRKSKN
ncbi:CotH kinase family protein [Butyrivibrio sp. AE3004]|uniref:CotH kinase family protein n=1 Tax=Butyrivibrio sp. AE3004 TaxID=1506994 RepID=UPI000494518C|nr:CotH kinase family protein [Butyrivibrio sp. AE3004]